MSYADGMSEFKDVGGTSGGLGLFAAGSALAAVSAWFFIDSVRVTTYGGGWMSGVVGGSTGVVFLPLAVGIIGLFYDARKTWPWIVTGIGAVILGLEIISRLNFFINLKLSHLLIMMVSFFGGIGLILRSIRTINERPSGPPWADAEGLHRGSAGTADRADSAKGQRQRR